MQRVIFVLLLAAPVALARGGNFVHHAAPAHLVGEKTHKEKKTPPNRVRGDSEGNYDLSVAGHYAGTGTATVSTTLTLSATVLMATGKTPTTLTATDLAIVNGYFKGSGMVGGIACTIQGRIDLPSAADDEQTAQQAITGRITGTFKDAAGNVGRIVGVQRVAAPTKGKPPKKNGDGDGSGGGDGGSGGAGGAGGTGGDGGDGGSGHTRTPPPAGAEHHAAHGN